MKVHALAALPLALLVLGCGKEAYQYVPVSGVVTMNNKPLPNVMVVFQPVGTGSNPNPGPGSSGKTDAQGRYTLKVVASSPRDGAVVGRHKVQIYPPDGSEDLVIDKEVGSPDDAPPSKPVPLVPSRYHDMSTLTFEVPAGGTDQANFALTRP